MTARYAQHVSPRITPQSEPIPGSSQIANSAGGYSFAVDDWTRLDRFLCLGNEGGSYYATERKLTQENAGCVTRCLDVNPKRTVDRIVEISEEGRAPKNDPAVFALALCASYTKLVGEAGAAVRRMAYQALPRVCRIGTHLFHFAAAVDEMRGWGRGLRGAVANWYASKTPADLANQVIKYQQRDSWSHRDLLRLCHVKDPGTVSNVIYHWVTKGWESVGEAEHSVPDLRPIWAFERAKASESKFEIVKLITDYRLPRECIPTKWLNEPEVWEALLTSGTGMPLTAMIRNLAKMTAVGLLAPLSDASRFITSRLSDMGALRKARIHPLAVLVAMNTYKSGKGDKGSLTWTPVDRVIDALDSAFYLTFKTIVPTGKRWLLALDVSGSMRSPVIAGMPGITPRVGSAAMALVTAASENDWHIVGFSTQLIPLRLSPSMRLDEAVRSISGLPFGGTDCAQPMLYAIKNNLKVDAFVMYTDSETWFNQAIHPCQALDQYRQRSGIGAKMIVVGMVSNGFTIANPEDKGAMDVVGFDTAVPSLMADFVRG